MPNDDARPHQMRIVGYDDEDRYVMTGMSSSSPRSLSIHCDLAEMLWIQPGTPVICKGLHTATHLNGQIGDVRRRDEESGRYHIHFANTSLNPARIQARNLRVLINVPDENEVNDDSYIVIVDSNSDDNKSFEDAEESLKDGEEEEEGFEDALESLPDKVKDKFDMKEISDKLAR